MYLCEDIDQTVGPSVCDSVSPLCKVKLTWHTFLGLLWEWMRSYKVQSKHYRSVKTDQSL